MVLDLGSGTSLDLALGLISGALVLATGAWIVLQRERGPARIATFFLVGWGVDITAANVDAVSPGGQAALTRDAFGLVLLPLIVAFLFQGVRTRRSSLAVVLAFAWSALGAVIMLLEPRAYLAADVSDAAGALRPDASAVSFLFAQIPLFLATGGAAIVLLRRAARPESITDARRLRLMGSAFACFIAAAGAWFSLRLAPTIAALLSSGDLVDGLVLAIYVASALTFTILIALHLHRAPMPREDRRLVAAALYAPLVTSAAAAIVFLASGPRVNPVGFWRIVTVALLVLAVLQHRLFDGAIRFRRTAIAGVTLFFAIGAALLSEGIARYFGSSALRDPAAALGVGIVFAVALIVPYLPASQRAARRAFRALVAPRDASAAQPLEIYRAALEARAAKGASLAREDPALVAMRRELKIDARDHDVLSLFVERRGAEGAPTFAPGDKILDGTLAVERVLGGSASARVYECRDEAGREVAVKVQAPLMRGAGSQGARVLHEAAALDRARSGHVLSVLEVADRPEAFYIVSERAAGTLADRLQQGTIPQAEALRIARDVLQGLAAAHAAGVVHCDVKPSNVLLSRDGSAILADFDSARSLGGADLPARGTPAWMAPEQFERGAITPSADVHAAGALLYRMLAGRHYLALDGLKLDEMRVMVARAHPVMPAEWPADVRAWLTRALAKDPKSRFADARDALAALSTLS